MLQTKSVAQAMTHRALSWVSWVVGIQIAWAVQRAHLRADSSSSHWAFQQIERPGLPVLANGHKRVLNVVDHFLVSRLEELGLSFSPAAGKLIRLRRATFDLTGLPPTPSELDAFEKDTSPDAYEKVIDRLLASPRYGERWGRHWLDLARYAETDGFEHDAARPHAWRYRDYVIRSFNEDKPYDRFVREQVAGDELWPDSPEALIATGFNLLGPDMVDSSDQVQRRHNTLNDMTDTTALAFLGLTLGCARCHDHKFEPLTQEDYYRLQACFAPATFRRDQTVAAPDERSAFEAAMKRFEELPKVQELAALETPVRARLREAKIGRLAPEARAAHLTPPAQRNAQQANLVLETESVVAVLDKELVEAFTAPERARRGELVEAIKHYPKPEPLPRALALTRGEGPPRKTHLLHRGDYSQPGAEVEAGFPRILVWAEGAAMTATNGRSALANWLVSTNNPLTARVIVNRVWRHHFGRGLAATPSDFGTRGQRPSHPELLDWLAADFMEHGWSLKRLHRLMMSSAAYRQESHGETGASLAASVDPENRFYWRMNRRRLEGESIRDSLLVVSGRLELKMGGPGVFPSIPEHIFKGAAGWKSSKDPRDHVRRSVYIFARRNLRFPFLEVFDAPDNNLSCSGRERSTTAPQALTLLNAEEVMAAAEAVARRVTREAGGGEPIAPLFRLVLGRSPTAAEWAMTREFLERSPMPELCRALFNVNDFVYVE